jgi:hypothetical protein
LKFLFPYFCNFCSQIFEIFVHGFCSRILFPDFYSWILLSDFCSQLFVSGFLFLDFCSWILFPDFWNFCSQIF